MSVSDKENSDLKYILANSKRWMLLIPIFIFSGIILGIGVIFREKIMPQDYKVQFEESENTNLGLTESGTVSINANNSFPGNSVIIEKVNLVSPGFVVIHEILDDYENSVFGSSSLLHAGESEAIIILLSKKTKENEIYYATLFSDDGDGLFNLEQDDKPMEDKDGKSVSVEIHVKSDVKSDENYITL